MYEGITYAQLKKLPAVEKPIAWKELKSLYSTQKELADKLGVGPAIVYNMISRYAAGGKKAAKLEVVETVRKTRTKAGKKAKKTEQDVIVPEIKPVVSEIKPIVSEINSVGNTAENDSFSIVINKMVSGEDAQFFLNGIGSTLLKSQKYVIEIKITEKLG